MRGIPNGHFGVPVEYSILPVVDVHLILNHFLPGSVEVRIRQVAHLSLVCVFFLPLQHPLHSPVSVSLLLSDIAAFFLKEAGHWVGDEQVEGVQDYHYDEEG